MSEKWIIASYLTWSAFMDVVREFPFAVEPEYVSEYQAELFEKAAAEIRRKLTELEGDEDD